MNTLNRYSRSGPVRGCLSVIAAFALHTTMNAQIDRSKAPAPAPAPVVNIGAYENFTLGNGMRVIVVENHKLPMVGVQVRFDIPPMAQGKQAGFIEMMGDLLATGTGKFTKADIDQRVDMLGAHLYTSSEGAYATALKKNLAALMPLFSDVVKAPSFPKDELEKARLRMVSEVQQRQDDASAVAEAVGRAVTFGRTHPYGEVVTEQSLRGITHEAIAAYHAKFFRPEHGYLVFVGDITLKEAKTMAKQYFGDWKPAQKYTVVNEDGSQTIDGIGSVRFLEKPAVPKGPRRVVIVDRPGAAQSVVRVSFPLNLEPKDVRAMSAQVMNTILGGGVFNARLMQNLREDKGWTYGTYSTLESDRFNAHFHTSANVRTAVTDSAIIETIKELERMRSGKVTADELSLAKSYMAGSFARSLEDPRTVARFALNTFLNQLPKDHYATYLKRLDAITADDVRAAAEAFLHPDNAVILVVGDKRELLARLQPLSWSVNPAVLELDHNGEIYVEEFEPVRGKAAAEVIEAYLQAIGGREAAARIKDMRMDLTATIAGMPMSITQWYGTDGLFRSEVKSGDLVVQEEAFDGERGMRSNGQGKVELEDMDLGEMQFNGHPVPELHYAANVERMVLAGRTTIDDKPVLKVQLSLYTGGTAGDYFDEKTGLKLRRVEEKYLNGQTYRITTEYADYQPVNGVLFPRSIEQYGGPSGEVRMTVTSIAANTGLKPSLFATNLPEKKVEEYKEPIEENPYEEPPGGKDE